MTLATFVTPDDACPWCGHELDRATALDDGTDPPVAGDASICEACRRVVMFEGEGDGLRLRRATDGEVLDVLASLIKP